MQNTILRKEVKSRIEEQYILSDMETVEMKIDESANSLIIERLIDMYTTPLESAIREVISNAIDTTKTAKNTHKAIKVTIPSPLKPTFSVRDYGEGMSKETLKTIYTQFGASTKRDDYNQIGAYGLGAKSPLAYTDVFTVESVKDNRLVLGMCNRDSNGFNFRIVKDEYSDMENYTEVSFDIDYNDLYARTSEYGLLQLLGKYKSLAKLEGVKIESDYKLPETEYTVFGKRRIPELGNIELEFIYNDVFPMRTLLHNAGKSYKGRYDFSFIVGGFEYSGKEPSFATEKGIVYPSRSYSSVPIRVKTPIGLLDFTSSRDNINYNSRYNKLISILTDIDFKEMFLEHLKDTSKKFQYRVYKNYHLEFKVERYNKTDVREVEFYKSFSDYLDTDKTTVFGFSVKNNITGKEKISYLLNEEETPLYPMDFELNEEGFRLTRKNILEVDKDYLLTSGDQEYQKHKVDVITEATSNKIIKQSMRILKEDPRYSGVVIATELTEDDFRDKTILEDIGINLVFRTEESLLEELKELRRQRRKPSEAKMFSKSDISICSRYNSSYNMAISNRNSDFITTKVNWKNNTARIIEVLQEVPIILTNLPIRNVSDYNTQPFFKDLQEGIRRKLGSTVESFVTININTLTQLKIDNLKELDNDIYYYTDKLYTLKTTKIVDEYLETITKLDIENEIVFTKDEINLMFDFMEIGRLFVVESWKSKIFDIIIADEFDEKEKAYLEYIFNTLQKTEKLFEGREFLEVYDEVKRILSKTDIRELDEWNYLFMELRNPLLQDYNTGFKLNQAEYLYLKEGEVLPKEEGNSLPSEELRSIIKDRVFTIDRTIKNYNEVVEFHELYKSYNRIKEVLYKEGLLEVDTLNNINEGIVKWLETK